MIFISIIVLLIRTVCWMIIRERNIVNKMLIFMKWDNKEASRIFFNFSRVPALEIEINPPLNKQIHRQISTSDLKNVFRCFEYNLCIHFTFRHASPFGESYSLMNAYDDSVSGVCCSTAVPARGGDILTRSGVRLGIICTYIIYLFTIYYTYVHIYTSKIYIYIYIKKRKNTLFTRIIHSRKLILLASCFVKLCNKSIDKLLSLLLFFFLFLFIFHHFMYRYYAIMSK